MSARRLCGNSQPQLFHRSKRPAISLPDNHPMVVLTDGKFRAAKEKLRKYRLFAKSKTKAAKNRMVAQMTRIIEGINQNLGKAIAATSAQGRKLRGHAVVAQRKLVEGFSTPGPPHKKTVKAPSLRHTKSTRLFGKPRFSLLPWRTIVGKRNVQTAPESADS
jgi:hypothetical protein